MYDYDDDRNQVRINLANLKNAIDSEKQDTDRLIIDLKADLREKSVEIESLEKEINELENDKRHYRIIADNRTSDVIHISCIVVFGCLLWTFSSVWGLI